MPDYLHPGVYIEEQPAPQTIEGVSTSTAGFVGATQKGPTDRLPQLITSFPDFLRVYGSYLPEEPWKNTRYLAYAVEGFFNNGGQRVYIKRVVDSKNAQKAGLTLNDGFVTRLAENTASLQAARNVVKLASLRGISVSSQLRFAERIAGQNEFQVRTVTAYNARQGSVTLNKPLTWQYTVAGCQVTLNGVNSPDAGNPSLAVTASSEGKWGESLEVSINDTDGTIGVAAAAPVKTTLRALPLVFSASGPNLGTETTLADVSQLQVGDMVEFSIGGATAQTERRTLSKITDSTIQWVGVLEKDYSGAGSTIHRVTALRTRAINPRVLVESVAGFQAGDLVRLTQGETTQLAQIATGGVDIPNRQINLDTSTHTIASSYLAGDEFALATAGREGLDQLNLSSTNNFYEQAVIEVDDGTRKDYYTVTQIVGNSLTVNPVLTRAVASGTVVRIVEFTLSVSDGTTTETFSNLSLDSDALNFVETIVNLRSRLISVENKGSTRLRPFNIPRTTRGKAANLTGSNDGDPPTADDYRGTDAGPGKRTGIKALADIDDISIIAVPGIGDPSVHAELINQCEQLKDRFAVLDPFSDSVIGSGKENTDIKLQRNKHDTFYAAMYYPWLRIRDPLNSTSPNDSLVPPSGHVIGIYARVDAERGVQKAPANEVIRGIAGVEIKLSDREQDVLNPESINVIRDFRDNNRGIRVWGSRCLTSDNAWKYVPVRRLFIFLEESLDEGLQWVVFEPNGEALWARVRRTISGFLRTLRLSGALAGISDEEAFFVKCDRTTMTQDDIDNGRLIILVGAAPLRPAEFVIVRVSQKTLEASS
jgi:phage tail sheath protein FI